MAAALLIGCAAPPLPVPQSAASRLETERRAWLRAHPQSYSFSYRDECFCPGAGAWVQITVVADTVARAVLAPDQGTGMKVGGTGFRRPTIDSLFARISQAYSNKSDSVDVRYDPRYHFPSHAYLDWRGNILDDEFAFDIQDFKEIPPEPVGR